MVHNLVMAQVHDTIGGVVTRGAGMCNLRGSQLEGVEALGR